MGGLAYPILADWKPHGALTRDVGIWLEEKGCASRTTVVVDKDGIVRDISTNPLGEDRDFARTMAILDRIQAGEPVKA